MKVWAIADSKCQGFLGFREFITAMQLVSLAQAGSEITQDALAHADLEKLNPPMMEGLDVLLTRNKQSQKRVDSELDVNSEPQSPPSTFQWFSSKSAKKLQRNEVIALFNFLNRLSESLKFVHDMGASMEKMERQGTSSGGKTTWLQDHNGT
ncbi:EH domain-containing protein 1-like isoform X2 [Curcuma longa]|uniref:EH domain-containing protein 1-like isoform X2 n=1 Tax=Curcuma longa TaxID=136217 RepID=UPI003D9EFA75